MFSWKILGWSLCPQWSAVLQQCVLHGLFLFFPVDYAGSPVSSIILKTHFLQFWDIYCITSFAVSSSLFSQFFLPRTLLLELDILEWFTSFLIFSHPFIHCIMFFVLLWQNPSKFYSIIITEFCFKLQLSSFCLLKAFLGSGSLSPVLYPVLFFSGMYYNVYTLMNVNYYFFGIFFYSWNCFCFLQFPFFWLV